MESQWVQLTLDVQHRDKYGRLLAYVWVNGRTVLYVGDNPTNRRLVEELLERRPRVQLGSAITGGGGLARACERPPDLILLDIHLPDMKALEVLQEVRRTRVLRRVPVIVLSAEIDATILQGPMLAAGAQGYVLVPTEFSTLVSLVDAHLAGNVGSD